MPIYLDNCATTCPFDQVVDVVISAMKNTYENPSAPYKQGLVVEKMIMKARGNIAKLAGVSSDNIYFTSGGTEANTTALLCYGKEGDIITSAIEHPSVGDVIDAMRQNGRNTIVMKTDKNGVISPERLSDAMSPDTGMVSIMHVNNEIGSLNDIKSLVTAAKNINPDVIFHCDGVQAFGKIELALADWGVDLYSMSSHKIHGPKGVGALYVSPKLKRRPLIVGGGQEHGMRSGTENVPGIVGFGEAAGMYYEHKVEFRQRLRSLQTRFIEGISCIDDIIINTPKISAPHVVNASFANIKGEVLLHALEDKGILINTGSACSSKRKKHSHTLKAMNIDEKYIDGTIRVSFCPLNTEDEIDKTIDIIKSSVKRLRMFTRR